MQAESIIHWKNRKDSRYEDISGNLTSGAAYYLHMSEREDRYATIREFLQEKYPEAVSISTISRQLNMNRGSVAKYLEVLQSHGNVIMKPYGKSKLYSIAQNVAFDDLFNYISDAIVILDADLHILMVNKSFIETFNIRSAKKIIGNELSRINLALLDNPTVLYIGRTGKIQDMKTLAVNLTSGAAYYLHMSEREDRYATIREFLQEKYPEAVSISTISRQLNMNRGSVAKYLEVLQSHGNVIMKPYGKSKLYSIAQNVAFDDLFNYISDAIVILDVFFGPAYPDGQQK